MNYKEILTDVMNRLDYEIKKKNDPSRFMFMVGMCTTGKLGKGEANEIKGWYHGLKSAKEIITRCICERCTEDENITCDKCKNADCVLRGKK